MSRCTGPQYHKQHVSREGTRTFGPFQITLHSRSGKASSTRSRDSTYIAPTLSGGFSRPTTEHVVTMLLLLRPSSWALLPPPPPRSLDFISAPLAYHHRSYLQPLSLSCGEQLYMSLHQQPLLCKYYYYYRGGRPCPSGLTLNDTTSRWTWHASASLWAPKPRGLVPSVPEEW